MAKSTIKKIVILLINILLYAIYGNYFIPIIATSLITYFYGGIVKNNKKIFVIFMAYLLILMPLIFFKYIASGLNINVLVPLGISYYTLALLSYINDIYKDKYSPSKNIIDFLMYSLYFPCLFIGPINRYDDFSKNIENISINKANIFDSLLKIGLGLIKKIIIANKLSTIILELSGNTSYGGLYVLFGCFIYSIYLYCDFSGGIDIILGISKIFNIDLVSNFDRPYLSESIKEFWRRWHISLGTWLKDYVYIPLGGNRKGAIKTKVNIILTFFISGLWHGIHYILWGIINGILVAFNFKTKNKYLNICLTFIIISFLWVFFIYNDTFLSLRMFASIFNFGDFNIWNLGLNIFDYVIVIVFLVMTIVYEMKNTVINNYLNKISFNKKLILLLGMLLLILLFGSYGLDINSSNFVYGNF